MSKDDKANKIDGDLNDWMTEREISPDAQKEIQKILAENGKQEEPIKEEIQEPEDTSEDVELSPIEEIRKRTQYSTVSLVLLGKKIEFDFYKGDEDGCLIAMPNGSKYRSKTKDVLSGIERAPYYVENAEILPNVEKWKVEVHSEEIGTLLFKMQ